MASKFKGYVPKTEAHILNARESLEEYTPRLGVYFKSLANNLCLPDGQNAPNPDTCYVYSRVGLMDGCDHECDTCNKVFEVTSRKEYNFNKADLIWEWMYLNSQDPVFIRSEPATHVKRLCKKSLLIIYGGCVIAEYCKGKNIILTTDWTNDGTKIDFVEYVLGELKTAEIISKVKKGSKPPKPNLTLGTDPEMEVIVSGNVIDAHHLPSLLEDRIGRDGAGYQRELRPLPGKTPEELINNIEFLINATDEQWSLIGEKYSLGGHIHVGGIKESKAFVNALDYFLEPLSKLNSHIRKSGDYGRKGDYRMQRYPSGIEGIEYRTPPSAWLSNKRLAMITLTIVYKVAERHYSGEDIDTTDNLEADLITIGVPEDMAKDYLKEIDKLTNNVPKDWRRAWGLKIKPKPTMDFRDAWDNGLKKYFEEEIKKHLIELEYSGNVVFYGCSTSRGECVIAIDNTFTIVPPSGIEIIPPVREGDCLHVGLGRTIRHDGTWIKKALPVVKEYLTRMVKG